MTQLLLIKLMRDLWRQRVQCLVIALIVACGVASQITSFSLIATLQSAMDRYYEQSRFPDLFAKVHALPLTRVHKLSELSGVGSVQPRITVDCPLTLPADPEDPAIATLIAVPGGWQASINRLVIRRGCDWHELAKDQVLVSEVFAEARQLSIGDTLWLKVQGQRRAVTVAGVAISPEFLFQIRDGAGVPDNRHYSVLWMRYEDLASATGLLGQFNDFVLQLRTDVSPSLIIEDIERTLGSDNIVRVHSRTLQVSHRYSTNGIGQLYSIAIVPPTVFFAVAAFLIYIALSRLIRMERESIAMLRAFGYSAWSVGLIYIGYVLSIVLLGCVLGIGGGTALAYAAKDTYSQIYRFPELPLRVDPIAVGYALLAACVVGGLGGGRTVWNIASLPPAKGLRSEPPASYRLSWGDRIAQGLRLQPLSRMTLRGMGRWPLRTVLGILGMGLGIGVMVLGSYTHGAIAAVIDFEFFLTRRYDAIVQFSPGTSSESLEEIRHLPGVLTVEGFHSGGFNISAGHHERSISVLGIASEGQLISPVGSDYRPVQWNGHGVALSERLAEVLGVELGSTVQLTSQEDREKSVDIRVEALVTDYSGLNAYIDAHDYQRWFLEGATIGGAFVTCDPDRLAELNRQLLLRPKVLAVTVKQSALENFETNDSKNLLLFRLFNMIFSCVIGIGAVYSVASISLLERQRDLALLRVIGYTSIETGRVLIGELLLMSILAMPVGCLTGYWFAWVATWMLNTDTQRVPMFIEPATYLSAVLVSVLSTLLAAVWFQRVINRMDCMNQLKSKD